MQYFKRDFIVRKLQENSVEIRRTDSHDSQMKQDGMFKKTGRFISNLADLSQHYHTITIPLDDKIRTNKDVEKITLILTRR